MSAKVVRDKAEASRRSPTVTTTCAQYDPSKFVSGSGVIVEGALVDSHFHHVVAAGQYHRYVAFLIDVDMVQQRRFDASGVEIEPEVHSASRKGKGWLNQFDTQKAQAVTISHEELLAKLAAGQGGARPAAIADAVVSGAAMQPLHPAVTGRFEFWGDASDLRDFAVSTGERLRLKTKADSLLIHSIVNVSTAGDAARRDHASAAKAYSGDNVGDAWQANLRKAQAATAADAVAPGADKEGVDDDEWDD